MKTEGHLALGFVVLIGLAISLVLVFLITLAGFFLARYRRKALGYEMAPTDMNEKTPQFDQVPPEDLFGSLGRADQAPRV